MSTGSLRAPGTVGIIGAGPAGLMAAEVLARAGHSVVVFDASRTVARKMLLAGKGGLNLTHGEPFERFVARYHGGGPGASEAIAGWLAGFAADDVRAWCAGLGIETFVGSSGRVFPQGMKAAPLVRAWLHRLRELGVRFRMRHRWVGWRDGQPVFEHRGLGHEASVSGADGPMLTDGADFAPPRAWILALGGASWPNLGSDGRWVPLLRQRGVAVADLAPSNCGFAVARAAPGEVDGPTGPADGGEPAESKALAQYLPGWSDFFRQRHAGEALKNVAASLPEQGWAQAGEILVTADGVEGNLIYAASSRLREAIGRDGVATLQLNLLPQWSPERVRAEVAHPRGARSWASHLKSRLNISGVKLALLREALPAARWADSEAVAEAIIALPLILTAPRPIAEAISSAGGVRFASLTPGLELHALPGFYCVGEMLDWDAPTGGYLLTACMASGRHAAQAILAQTQQAAG